jgi:GNAT superfamily N-acetyltransferase
MTLPSLRSPSEPAAPIVITDPRVRPLADADIERTVQLIYELAVYERLPEQCHVTADQLRAALFAAHPAVFALAAFESADPDAAQVGYALYFLNFSTWEGVHGIYLEDLYVTPSRRGSGLGKALLTTLAATAAARGYARVEWSVLDWNTPSIEFYRSLGAVPMAGWSTFRLTGDALAAVAGR